VLFAVDVVITLIFNADVEAQSGAYATGVLVLIQLRHILTDKGGAFSLAHVTERVGEILSLLHFDDLTEKVPLAKKQIPNIFIRLGDATLRHVNDLRFLTSFTGSVFSLDATRSS
jgi:hypothetical protein